MIDLSLTGRGRSSVAMLMKPAETSMVECAQRTGG
jgi:hypothetical protein